MELESPRGRSWRRASETEGRDWSRYLSQHQARDDFVWNYRMNAADEISRSHLLWSLTAFFKFKDRVSMNEIHDDPLEFNLESYQIKMAIVVKWRLSSRSIHQRCNLKKQRQEEKEGHAYRLPKKRTSTHIHIYICIHTYMHLVFGGHGIAIYSLRSCYPWGLVHIDELWNPSVNCTGAEELRQGHDYCYHLQSPLQKNLQYWSMNSAHRQILFSSLVWMTDARAYSTTPPSLNHRVG